MAPMWTNETSSTNSTIWIVTSLGFLATMVTIWTMCACCYRKKQRKEADAPTHGDLDKKLKMDSEGRTSINQSLDLETSENSLSDGSFPTVFEMQLKRSKKRLIKKESDPDRSKSTKSTVESRKEAAAKRSMMVGNVSSSISVSLTSLQSCKSDQKSASQRLEPPNRRVTLAKSPAANSKSTSNGKLAVQSLFVVVIGLLLVPTSATMVKNEEVADIGLSICVVNHFGDRNVARVAREFVSAFLIAITDHWPIGDNGMRIAIGEWTNRSTTEIRLNITDGGKKVSVGTTSIGHRRDADQSGWDGEPRFKSAYKVLRENIGSSPRPKLLVGITLLFRQPNDDLAAWIRNTVNASWIKMQLWPDDARMDQYFICQVGLPHSYVASFNNSGVDSNCCKAMAAIHVGNLTRKMLDAIQVHLRSCPLEKNERCYLDDNDNCKANFTYTPKPTASENSRFCWNRPPVQGNCSDPNAPECPKKATTSLTTDKTNTTKSIKTSPISSPDVFEPSINTTAFNATTDAPIGGFIFSAWFGCSIVALVICFVVVVINVYRQCSAFIKHKRQRKQELAEMGMVLTASRVTRKARKRVYSKVQPTYVKLSPKPKPSKRQ